MKKFCPKCGVTINKGTFCKNCTQTDLTFKPIKIRLCPSKRCFHKGKWSEFIDLHSLTQKLVLENFSQKVQLEQGLEQYPDILNKTGIKKDFEISISYQNYLYQIPISIEVTTSPTVAKVGSEYFEGILQIRNSRPEVLDYLKDYLQKNHIYINNIIEKEASADLYFVDKKKIKTAAAKVIRHFGGYLDLNEQLFSRNHLTSKDIFRLNAKLVIPNFKEKDIIMFQNEVFQVSNLDKEITAFNLIKAKKYTFSYNQKAHNDIKLVQKNKTQVSKINPEIEILNENYESVRAKNPYDIKVKPGQKIVAIKFKQKYYILK